MSRPTRNLGAQPRPSRYGRVDNEPMASIHQDIQLGVTPDEAWAADVLPDTVVPMVHGLTEQGATAIARAVAG